MRRKPHFEDKMIIRITVHDRKYMAALKEFANTLNSCDMFYDDEFADESEKRMLKDQHHFEMLHRLVVTNKIDVRQTLDYIALLKSKFQYYCINYPLSTISQEESEYLISRLDISVITTIAPKDEDGEVLYIFPSKLGMYNQTIIL